MISNELSRVPVVVEVELQDGQPACSSPVNHAHRLVPVPCLVVLQVTVGDSEELAPANHLQFTSPIIDGTERPLQRPKNKRRQREFYSGKKKRHTVKNVVIVDRRTRKIKALSRTRVGKTNDKRVADEEEYRFPKRSTLWKDTGFQGCEPPNITTIQPKKRPRKGKLTDEEKAQNRAISQQRVRVEHAIGGAKTYRIASDVFRNRREGFVDLSFETACGLHNLRCNYRLSQVA
jgi:hypothetical protein